MLERLFPNEGKFFAQFSRIAEHLTRSARLLEEGFDQPARWQELLTQIEDVERQGDEASHAVDVGTEQMFIPPMDREDIHLLSTELRRVVDIVGGTARRAVSLRATERREPTVQMAKKLVGATEEIENAVAHIKDSTAVLERCEAIRRWEEEGDTIHSTAVSELFQGRPNPIDVLRWKTLYDQLEEALDACEDVADELETITVKHE
jgi:uncharacterized protein Yka (UPF0111/DUF47 family)